MHSIHTTLRSAYRVFIPYMSFDQRKSRRIFNGVLMLNRMAKDMDQSQPNQAAELRLLAGRG